MPRFVEYRIQKKNHYDLFEWQTLCAGLPSMEVVEEFLRDEQLKVDHSIRIVRREVEFTEWEVVEEYETGNTGRVPPLRPVD